jgi:hypothetical protein
MKIAVQLVLFIIIQYILVKFTPNKILIIYEPHLPGFDYFT